ncbi:uncharacterized protein LOC132068918 [Lycium ferocissimum]|uniref:uncharacterized protein LOC132068918 n=1 Tax=Lycium ferocissimum TaxID=112874 RepID=UPI0028166093|nr:uncharacterized protein LOC132068918 [Lycium ferocissimum]
MQAYGRMKRVTDPFDDKMKARIIGRDPQENCYLSSGSEHSAHAVDDDDDDDASCSFSNLIFGFPDDMEENASSESDSDSDNEDVSACKEMNLEHKSTPKTSSRGEDCSSRIKEITHPLNKRCETLNTMYDSTHDVIEDVPKPIFYSGMDLFRNSVSTKVKDALKLFSFLKSNKPILRRNVMTYLRGFGYNAAICKTKWESSGGLKAGNYEFIDVFRSDNNTRYVIDLDFAAEFEIARPTNHYERLLKSLPNVFVGKSEELKCILKVMSDGARLSLRSKELLIPPWRKNRFMQNKWLGAYKRTINILPSVNDSSALLLPLKQTNVVKCRSVGFNAAVNGRLVFPAAPRTR